MDKKKHPPFFLETQEKRRQKNTPPAQHCVGNYVFGIPMYIRLKTILKFKDIFR
jgi:hypothetical protein